MVIVSWRPREMFDSGVWHYGFCEIWFFYNAARFNVIAAFGGHRLRLSWITFPPHLQGLCSLKWWLPAHTHVHPHTHTHTLYKVTDIKQREWHMLYTRRADLNCIWTRVSEECHHLIHKAWTVSTELLVLETWPPVGLYFHEKNKINIAVKNRL